MQPRNEDSVARFTARYPQPDMTPAEFEEFVVELLRSGEPASLDFTVTLHETVQGFDGGYDIDATVRYAFLGMDFLVLVEAKHHQHPIKRELVQVLHQKCTSVGAQKALMVSTAPYQSGAVAFARAHGIALLTVTEGRYTFETKSADGRPALTREQALDHFGLPAFAAHLYTAGETPTTTLVQLVTPAEPAALQEWLRKDPSR
ncbi:restriction endonuclease [Streptomyces sp. H39-S7]|uniref:restriction endonuclease n=1 Tax=Streptomyces sp. H39-S7 TaxID=3004357 RepID=UPI0022AFBBEE|nr:restriction endonuclease [Streptomyces sp. H39-S7]MCZ4120257.1 restriction endonuclease [Streptomyces sp. H39-S7]